MTGERGTPSQDINRNSESVLAKPVPTKYWAFLSYSHKDEAWATWLHQALETYRIPRQLVGKPGPDGHIPERIFPVFRDRDDLSSAPSLSTSIQQALFQSRFLIVICSPHAVASNWVNEEVRLFKSLGRESRVFCLIVDGEPPECFPPALRFPILSNGTLGSEPVDPLAADVRRDQLDKEDAKLRLVAGILGVGFDELKQRDRKRRLKRRMRASATALGVAGILGFAYIGLIDVSPDLPLPGHRAIAEFLDFHQLSLFRTLYSEDQIQRKSVELRKQLLARLLRNISPNGHVIKNPSNYYDVWTTAQSLCSISKAPETSIAQLRGLRKSFDAVSHSGGAPDAVYEANLDKAEPRLWTASALAAILQHRNQLQPETVQEYWKRLQYTQKILEHYQHRRQTGGWSMFHYRRDERSDHYTSALALMALLETREAGLPWGGSDQRRDELILSTARYLAEGFEEDNNRYGWHLVETLDGRSPDGLTFQIYSELLRAESVPGFVIPPRILRYIPIHLSQISDRGVDFPNQSEEIFYRQGSETVEFLWYPWGIQAAWLWLERERSHESPDSHLNTIRVRQALGHLVVNLGSQAVEKAEKEDAFRTAEMLYALGRIPLLGSHAPSSPKREEGGK